MLTFHLCEVWANEANDLKEMTLYGPQQIPDNGNPSPNADILMKKQYAQDIQKGTFLFSHLVSAYMKA